MTFKVGDEVVCVDDTPRSGFGFGIEMLPVRGRVYVIRELEQRPVGLGIRLVEITNEPKPYREGFHECWFRASRFRPAVKRKTDISIFTAMLTPSKTKERV